MMNEIMNNNEMVNEVAENAVNEVAKVDGLNLQQAGVIGLAGAGVFAAGWGAHALWTKLVTPRIQKAKANRQAKKEAEAKAAEANVEHVNPEDISVEGEPQTDFTETETK